MEALREGVEGLRERVERSTTHGCARDPVGETLADRAMSDAVEASVDEPPRESRPAPRPAQPATGGPVEVRVDGLRVGARGLVAVAV